MAPLNEQPSDVGRSAVRKSGCGKSYQIGKEKRASSDRPIAGEKPTYQDLCDRLAFISITT
jgi:hypothetical protein